MLHCCSNIVLLPVLCFRFMALVCTLREEVFERKGNLSSHCHIFIHFLFLTGLVEYNFHCFRDSIQQVSHCGCGLIHHHGNTAVGIRDKTQGTCRRPQWLC